MTTTTNIIYASDIHLEINGLGRANCKFADGDVLILAGDCFNASMGYPHRTDTKARSYKKGLEYLKREVFPKYGAILYVMGNHDHYDHVFKHTQTAVETQFCDVPNFHLLENETFTYNDILFVGCTLWTDFLNNNPVTKVAAQTGMNDYHLIGEKSYEECNYEYWAQGHKQAPCITPDYIYSVHMGSRRFLEETLATNLEAPTVVITHHPPSYKCLMHPDQASYGINPCFASDMDQFLMSYPQLLAWVHGHTHHDTNLRIGLTSVVSNQCGYYLEGCYFKWRPNKRLTINNGKVESNIAV